MSSKYFDKYQTPNTKHQMPNTKQTPNHKHHQTNLTMETHRPRGSGTRRRRNQGLCAVGNEKTDHETNIERGLECRGGTTVIDDIVMTSFYYKASLRVRNAVIVAKAWQDGATPHNVVTTANLT
eukprot:jgi/Psemu1/47587/gm1.47587_g